MIIVICSRSGIILVDEGATVEVPRTGGKVRSVPDEVRSRGAG